MHASGTQIFLTALLGIAVHGVAAEPVIREAVDDMLVLAESSSIPTLAQRRARLGFQTLQHMYSSRTGLWKTTGWWNSANALTAVANMALNDADHQPIREVASRIFSETLARAPRWNPQPGAEDGFDPHRDTDIAYTYTYNKTVGPSGEYITRYPESWWDSLTLAQDQDQDIEDNKNSTTAPGLQSTTLPPAPRSPNPHDWLDGYYDDDLWWALAWISAYDLTLQTRYLRLAEGIFRVVAKKAWPTHCFDGGVYWGVNNAYVNTITNELFFSTAAHLATRVQGRKGRRWFLDWAEKSLEWFLASGMVNSEGTVNDGLDWECRNNGRTVWSYNQGVILGGLVQMHYADASNGAQSKSVRGIMERMRGFGLEMEAQTSGTPYLALATHIAHAALRTLASPSGILQDPCEPSNCGADGTQFKGIFVRNRAELHKVAPSYEYEKAILRNAESIWVKDRRGEGDTVFGVCWGGPWVEPGNASTQSSALDALVAALGLELAEKGIRGEREVEREEL